MEKQNTPWPLNKLKVKSKKSVLKATYYSAFAYSMHTFLIPPNVDNNAHWSMYLGIV